MTCTVEYLQTESTMARRAVFLDRDGVLTRPLVRDGRPYAPMSAAEMEIEPEAPEALASLRRAGFLLIVASNQPDVARGTLAREDVDAMHRALAGTLPLDDIFVCCHDDADACDCRKPRPGMLIEAARKYGIELTASFLIGDRWRDIDAGRAAGCRTVWIDRGYGERQPAHPPDVSVASLAEAVRWILERA